MQLCSAIPPIGTYYIRRPYIARIHHTSIVYQGLLQTRLVYRKQ